MPLPIKFILATLIGLSLASLAMAVLSVVA